MVEFAIIFPLFLAVLLFAWWWGFSYNARNSLASAVALAPRQAFARGQTAMMNREIIPAVHSFISTSNTTAVRPLLSTPGLEIEAFGSGGGGGWYRSQWQQTFGPSFALNRLPPSYIYALVYAYQAMKMSVGNTLRFPCDPNAPDGFGCMRCRNLNASTTSTTASTGTQPVLGAFDYNTNFVGIECEYRPDNVILEPLVGLLTLFGGSASGPMLVFRQSAFYKVDSGAFDPTLRSL